MQLVLKRFYQAVDIDAPDKVGYFLVFGSSDGREILLPVQKETTEELVKAIYSKPSRPTPPVEEAAEEEGQEEESEEPAKDEQPEEEELEEEMEEEDFGGASVFASNPTPTPKKKNFPKLTDGVPSL